MPAGAARRYRRRLRRISSQLLVQPFSASESFSSCRLQLQPSAADLLGVRPTSDQATALQQLQEHGICILADVLQPAEVARLRGRAEVAAVAHDSGTSADTWHVPGVLTHEVSTQPTSYPWMQ